MTTHTHNSRRDTDAASPALSSESTSLLPNNSGSLSYDTNNIAGTGTRSHTRPRARTGTWPEEEEPLLSKSVTQEASCRINPKPAPSLSAKSSVDWVFRKLTGRSYDEVSLSLQNSGSVARDHLALERTFLAYMRTSLAIASAGVALVQLFNTSNKTESERVERYARPLGASVIAMGLIVLGVGLARYFTVQSALVKGSFPVARLSTTFIAVALTALVTVVFSLLVNDKFKLSE